MSKSRQAKRKKQQKLKHKKSLQNNQLQPVFNGYMNFYLDGENTDQLLEQVEFDGDWKNIRGRILGKNKKDFKGRKFKVTLYLVNTAGKLGNEVVEMLDRSSIELLVETIGSMSTELAENSEHDIDLPKSYAVVRA